MKCLRFYGPEDVRLENIPTPEPEAGQVLCKVECAGICRTDFSLFSGTMPFVSGKNLRYPFIPGHEWSGTVIKTGGKVKTFKIGDRIVGDTVVACGKCEYCAENLPGQCENLRCVGTINAWNGALAEFIIMPERHLFPLPEIIDFENGALIEPASIALNAVKQIDIHAGDVVLVAGAGPIGIIGAVFSKIKGAEKVIIADKISGRMQKAIELGSDHILDLKNMDLPNAISPHTFNKAIEATGSAAVFTEIMNLIRKRGIICPVAFYKEPLREFDLNTIVFNDLKIKPVGIDSEITRETIELMASAGLDLSSIITRKLNSLEEAANLFNDKNADSYDDIKIIVNPN